MQTLPLIAFASQKIIFYLSPENNALSPLFRLVSSSTAVGLTDIIHHDIRGEIREGEAIAYAYAQRPGD